MSKNYKEGNRKPRNNNSKSNGTKNKSKAKRDNSKDAVDSRSVATNGITMNDPNWYFTDSELATQATSISFNQFLGSPYQATDSGTQLFTPTTCIISMNPSAGFVDQKWPQSSGINMQGMKLYTLLSSGNAKTTNYAPQDLTMLLLAFGNVLENISFIRRFFGLAFTYNQRNRVYPENLLQQLGLNANDFFEKMADYRLQFNTIINVINKVPMLSNIAYFQKCASLYDQVFLDDISPMSQTYAFLPYSYWVIDEAYDTEGTGLKTNVWSEYGFERPMEFYLAGLRNQIDALLNSSTLNYIYSDLLNYANRNNVPLYNVPIIPEDYVVAPIFSEEALLQINNLRIVGIPSYTGVPGSTTILNDVSSNADRNAVRYKPQFPSSVKGTAQQTLPVLNFASPTPDVAQIIEASRLTYWPRLVEDNIKGSIVFGDHYVVSTHFYGDNVFFFEENVNNDVSPAEVAAMAKFGSVFRLDIADASGNLVAQTGDLNFFTTVDGRYLRRINDLAIQGLFELR